MRKVALLAAVVAILALAFAPASAHEEAGCSVVGPGVGVDPSQEWIVTCTVENAPAGTYRYVAVVVNDWTITVNGDAGDRMQPPIQQRTPDNTEEWVGRETGTFEVPEGATIVATIEGGCGNVGPVGPLCGSVGLIVVQQVEDENPY